MSEIFVVIEHRQGEVRDIALEMLWKAGELCDKHSHDLTAVLLCAGDEPFIDDIRRGVDRLVMVEDAALKTFNGDLYKEVLSRLIGEYRPVLTLMGHTAWGMDYAPALSVKAGLPLATDCVDILIENDRPRVIRQVYTGKLFSRVAFKEAPGYLVTVRAGAFQPDETAERRGEVVTWKIPSDLPQARTELVAYEDTGTGEVDISQADRLVSVGRGIGEEENLPAMKELAERMGGVLACSRPVVDKNWLPKYHQVGTSGKTVKPKIYLALGISGAFQHVAGISGAGTVIAVNKDRKAPIFRMADYGVVDDLMTVTEALKEKLKN